MVSIRSGRIVLSLIGSLLVSCHTLGCMSADDSSTSPDSEMCAEPENVSPTNESMVDDPSVILRWKGETPPFDVYFEKNDSTPDRRILAETTATSYNTGVLAPASTYYWQVRSSGMNSYGEPINCAGPVWSFQTTTSTCPSAVVLVFPEDQLERVDPEAVRFEWLRGPDPNVNYRYRLYLERDNPDPGLRVADQPDTTYTQVDLAYDAVYYWRVIARDYSGGAFPCSSVVYSFSTCQDISCTDFKWSSLPGTPALSRQGNTWKRSLFMSSRPMKTVRTSAMRRSWTWMKTFVSRWHSCST